MHGERSHIAPVFGALVDLQPLRWCERGLICAPWLNQAAASDALKRCPLPTSPTTAPPVVPDTPARLIAGWYRRTDQHAPAPATTRELVQRGGEGFGPHDHPTTTMCLAAMDRLGDGPAIDVGCGSGLLTQAWLAAGKGSVVAIDADPAAVAQTTKSLSAAGLHVGWRALVARIESLSPDDLRGSTVLANLPAVAHAALIHRLTKPPRAIVISGTGRGDDRPIVDHCRGLGMRLTHVARAGRYVCSTLVGR